MSIYSTFRPGTTKKVTIVEMTDHINDGGNFLHMLGLKYEISKRGLAIDFNTRVKAITTPVPIPKPL